MSEVFSSPATRFARRVATHPGLSDFQRQVYRALLTVPAGRVISYGTLARWVGCGSARAVGGALRTNPFAPEVPCHRVIGANGSLGGFQGSSDEADVARKRRLLAREGVVFDAAGRLCDPNRLISAPKGSCPAD